MLIRIIDWIRNTNRRKCTLPNLLANHVVMNFNGCVACGATNIRMGKHFFMAFCEGNEINAFERVVTIRQKFH